MEGFLVRNKWLLSRTILEMESGVGTRIGRAVLFFLVLLFCDHHVGAGNHAELVLVPLCQNFFFRWSGLPGTFQFIIANRY